MEASEITTEQPSEGDRDENKEVETAEMPPTTALVHAVDLGTLSTDPPPAQKPPPIIIDNTEVAAMTDPASLDGDIIVTAADNSSELTIEKEDSTVSNDSDGQGEVPAHARNGGDDDSAADAVANPPSIPQPEEQVAVNKAETNSTQSDPLPDSSVLVPLLKSSALKEHSRSSSVDGTTPTTTAESPGHEDDDDDVEDAEFDEYIRSPEVQNAIVERSPGGRYVRFMEKLGSGASKDVYRAYDTQEGIEVAWNVVNLSGVPKAERNRLVNEVRLLERLHHHNIISFHGSWVNRERQEVNFVTEILSSGTLKSFIAKVQVIRWKIAKRWAVQILKGLEYLHMQDPPVIHRDLKCENIFINGTSGDLRIGDLGLSTVHRNGRVLSVLGTPEFMAPDMYEESSYDQRVDIYAFGMCMLEIFTKEIPYRECQNPAQIYKKVSNGEPPEVLSRLRSRHAREFVQLCLGYKDENGEYVRPTATELLQHPFLVKRANEDDEVVVDPPLRERVISEVGEHSSSSGGTPTKPQPTRDSPPIGASGASPSQARGGEQISQRSPPKQLPDRMGSLDEDLSDKFDEMPQTESNMKKVKVMMGRGQELEEDEISEAGPVGGSPGSDDSANVPPKTAEVNASVQQQPPASAPPGEQQAVTSLAPQQSSSQHYLVAAAVLEKEGLDIRPYPDDVLKLVVTLPVEGQTQNVQFDFHLVQDDPVQVAKEMVQELGIPQGAVLEISETISGLARSARMRVDNFYNRVKQAHGHVRTHSQQQQQQQQHHSQSQPQGHQPHETSQNILYKNEGPQVSEYPNAPQHQQSHHSQSQLQGHQPHETSQNILYKNEGPQVSEYPSAPQHQQSQVPDYSNTAHHAPAPAPASHHQPGHVTEYPNVIVHHNTAPSQQQQQQQQQPGNEQGVQVPTQPVSQQHSMYVQHQGVQYGNAPPSQNQKTAPQSSYAPQQNPLQPQHNGTPTPPPMTVPPPSQQGNAPIHSQQQVSNHPDHSMHGQHQAIQPQQHGSGPPQGMASQQGLNLQQGSQAQVMPSQQGAGHGIPSQQPPVQAIQPQPSMTVPPTSTQSLPTGTTGMNAPVSSQATGLTDGNGSTAPLASAPASAAGPTYASAPPLASAPAPAAGPTYASAPPNVNSAGPSKPMTAKRANTVSGDSPDSSGHRRRQFSFSGSPEQISPMEDLDSEQADPDLEAELRKLDEDFQRNFQRAKKVFDNRMDNLQRSQVEREAQHKKTLEKHEKERVEFEKRLAQEAEQQNKRLEQLQREWDRKRETLSQRKLFEGVVAPTEANDNNIPANQEPAVPSGPPPASPPPPPAPAGRMPRNNSSSSQMAATAAASATATAEYNQQVDMNGNER